MAPYRIDLYDEISFWGWSSERFIRELRAAAGQDLELHLNSPGGDVFEGFAIANALRTHQGKKVAIVDGLCASAATFPAVVCDELVMYDAGMLMIHDPWGLAIGGAEDMEAQAEVLRKITDQMVALYARKTKASEEQIRAWVSAETWFTPKEAKAAGFCDRIADQAAKIDARAVQRYAARWRNPPQFQALAKPAAPKPSPSPRGNMDRKTLVMGLASALALAMDYAQQAADSSDQELQDAGTKILGSDKLPELVAVVMPLAQKEGAEASPEQAREMVNVFAVAQKITGQKAGLCGALDALKDTADRKVAAAQLPQDIEMERLLKQGQAETKLTPQKAQAYRDAIQKGERSVADLKTFLATALPAVKGSNQDPQGKNDGTPGKPKALDSDTSEGSAETGLDADETAELDARFVAAVNATKIGGGK